MFEGKRFLLKSVHYASLARADGFTLPCSQGVRSITGPPSFVFTLTFHHKHLYL